MSLLKAWAPYFQSQVRSRGRAYQMAGQVRQVAPGEGELMRAEVEGDDPHTVVFKGDGTTASAQCTCSYFSSGSYCMHIWAVVLDAHNHGGVAEFGPAIEKASPAAPKARRRSGEKKTSHREPDWVGKLSLLATAAAARNGASAIDDDPSIEPEADGTHDAAGPWSGLLRLRQRQMCYVISVERSSQHAGVVVETWQRHAIATGWSRPKPWKIDNDALRRLDDPADREIGATLLGAVRLHPAEMDHVPAADRSEGMFSLRAGSRLGLLRQMIATGRCMIDPGQGPGKTLNWEETPWRLWAVGARDGADLVVDLELRRGDERLAVDAPDLVIGGEDGIVIHRQTVAPFDDRRVTRWVTQARDEFHRRGESTSMRVAEEDIERFLDRLYMLAYLPEIDFPDDVGRPIHTTEPVMHLDLVSPRDEAAKQLIGKVWFEYDGLPIVPSEPNRFLTDDRGEGTATLIQRDAARENDAVALLAQQGFRANPNDEQTLQLAARQMPDVVRALTELGWQVSANQHRVRRATTSRFTVTSGIDWFELRGGVRFETSRGEQIVPLPEILAAARSGTQMIRLDDGSEGMLPIEWLHQHRMIAGVAEVESDHLRFRTSQVALLDALLAAQEMVTVDGPFDQVRQRLRQFERIEPIRESERFHGELRHYQRDGMGWFEFLRWFGAGGILADDMGLGKTVQVLAMLHRRYGESSDRPHRPTLIVVPRSVVFNWIDEARRFAPELRICAYAGSDRSAAFDDIDMIVTSYGLLRRDILTLKEKQYDYIVLDEAQSIKNPSSQSAKAARLLRCDHRLALTGTPVENHLGDIWSIFEFLNPGMLGSAGRFGDLIRGSVSDLHSHDAATEAALALRPFILRRTKQQVLTELPEKTEQTIVCQMESEQRDIYDELLKHYRGTLLKKIDSPRVGGAAMMVLEALLRLRQAACHPGLIDKRYETCASAKLDALADQLAELIDEGHKALVFSQFTSFLALVRSRLEDANITYEYLDGQTRDRKERVERFQNDTSCPVFLISLKAGGLGLNLTAAEYVFILDPWWNPAVESQAIDRAHRIGQTRHVFAYRLVCEDTVEQRIIELQESKKKLANAIVGGQGNLLKSLTREELSRLLS